jgi:hypothetical protein
MSFLRRKVMLLPGVTIRAEKYGSMRETVIVGMRM